MSEGEASCATCEGESSDGESGSLYAEGEGGECVLSEGSIDDVMAAEEETLDGAVVILSHKHEDGSVEYVFEEKSGELLSLIGGHINVDDADEYAAMVREINEEFGEEAASRLITALEKNRSTYKRMEADVDGKRAFTFVYDIQIQTTESWDIIKNGFEGKLSTVKLEDMLGLPENKFAFGQGPMMLEHANRFYGKNEYVGTSSDVITHYQLVDLKISQPPISVSSVEY